MAVAPSVASWARERGSGASRWALCSHTLGRARDFPLDEHDPRTPNAKTGTSWTGQRAIHRVQAANEVSRVRYVRQSSSRPWHPFRCVLAAGVGYGSNLDVRHAVSLTQLEWLTHGPAMARPFKRKRPILSLTKKNDTNSLDSHHGGGHCHPPHWPHRVWQDLFYPVCNRPRPENNA